MVAKSPPRRPALSALEAEAKRDQDEMSAAWAFIWILFAFKMATVFLIYWASQSYDTGMFLVATTWFWLIIPLVACAAPLLFRYRLLKVRRRRAQLRRSEWLLDDDLPDRTTGTRAANSRG
ncbi:MAG: hypothetical protein M3R02_02770 [Chloroflexota bacterium]|nr:hypothetical protein [Chloroflexota bacterium]